MATGVCKIAVRVSHMEADVEEVGSDLVFDARRCCVAREHAQESRLE